MYSGAYAGYFMMFNKDCRARYEMYSWKVKDSSNVFNFWHQLDDPGLKDLYQLVLPAIKLNHLIYIPMTKPQVDLKALGLSKKDEDKQDEDAQEEFKGNFLREFEGTPLLNHASEMYDDEKHVRVRINSSKLFPKDFD